MKKLLKYALYLTLLGLGLTTASAQSHKWKKGITSRQNIFETAPFPESHSATIAETPQGMIAAWFGGTKERNPDVEIWVSHLKNNQWTKPVSVANGIQPDGSRMACWNPVLYQVPNGELWLFYKIGPNVAGWKAYIKRSADHGHTWSNAEALPEGFIGPVKNKPVMVGSRILCPSSTEGNGWKVHFEYTDDLGKTWHKMAPINDGKTMITIQPSILKYADGRLQILCRTQNRVLAQSWSTDNGDTWSAMEASPLPNGNSGTDAVTLQDGRQLLVYNHVKPHDTLPRGKGPRTPLNVAVTKDGKKWYAALVLEDSPISQYSYPSVIQAKNGLVHIVYTWRREKITHVVVDPNQLKLKRIKNEKWPGKVKHMKKEITED